MKISRVDNREQGFTIVELLIVVVVIAILAAITIVAYNGINQRATSSATIAELTQLERKIEVDVLHETGDSIAIATPIIHVEGSSLSGTLPEPLVDIQEVTLYGVFDTHNNTTASNWSNIITLGPTTTNNALRLRTGASGNSSARGFYATSEQTNHDLTQANVLNTEGRHVGWISTLPDRIYAGFDAGTMNAALTPHSGWDFQTVNLYSNASYTSVAALVFPEYHDAQTRTQVVNWLTKHYTVGP
jgi:prepilin-type N-terminal cleavage/methylation domain-containing protein